MPKSGHRDEVSAVKAGVLGSTVTDFFHFEAPVAEDATHHLLRVLLSIPVLPVELFDTLLDHLLTLSLCRMETFLRTCATAMESAG